MARRCKRVKNYMHCTLKHKRFFDRRSFRVKRISKNKMIVVGCPKSKWSPRTKRCKVATQGQKIMKRVK